MTRTQTTHPATIPPLSPGRITALWLVLRSVSTMGPTSRDTVVKFARSSSLRAAGLPISDGCGLAIAGHLVEFHNGRMSLGPLGEEAMRLCDEDEPSDEARVFLVTTLMLMVGRPWLAFWSVGEDEVVHAFPEAVDADEYREIVRLGLLENSRENRWFWTAATHPHVDFVQAQLVALGRAAEQLTMEYERHRLLSEGFASLSRRVRLVALESSAYGYDVASFWGQRGLAADRNPESPLAIEVKAMAGKAVGLFRLFLTNHEWRVAEILGGDYLFYLWDDVQIGPPQSSSRSPRAILHPTDLSAHVPQVTACGSGGCRWSISELWIPLQGD